MKNMTFDEVKQEIIEGKHKYAYLMYHDIFGRIIKLRASINVRKGCFKWEIYQGIGMYANIWTSTTRPCKAILKLNSWRYEE